MRLLQYRIEHRCEFSWREIDDPEHLGGRGLLLQGFTCLGDQPRILDRDYRLRREVLQQRDLLVRKWAGFLAIHLEHTEQSIVSAERDAQQRLKAADLYHRTPWRYALSINVIIGNIRKLDGVLSGDDAGYLRPRRGPDRSVLTGQSVKFSMTAASHRVEALAVKSQQATVSASTCCQSPL